MSKLLDAVEKAKKKGRLRRGKITPSKAAEMLTDGTAHGRPLTDKQRRWLYHEAGDYKWTTKK